MTKTKSKCTSAWGDSPPASALFADNMWYKTEAYIGSEYAGKILYENGLTPIVRNFLNYFFVLATFRAQNYLLEQR